jgi:hypothetical protein
VAAKISKCGEDRYCINNESTGESLGTICLDAGLPRITLQSEQTCDVPGNEGQSRLRYIRPPGKIDLRV